MVNCYYCKQHFKVPNTKFTYNCGRGHNFRANYPNENFNDNCEDFEPTFKFEKGLIKNKENIAYKNYMKIKEKIASCKNDNLQF